MVSRRMHTLKLSSGFVCTVVAGMQPSRGIYLCISVIATNRKSQPKGLHRQMMPVFFGLFRIRRRSPIHLEIETLQEPLNR